MRIPEITLVAASRLSYRALADLINQTYADYYYNVWFTTSQFRRICYEEDIDLEQSVVALAGDEPIGQVLLSIRDTRGWISGVGVLPRWRRRGVATQMIKRIQERSHTRALSDLRLEVLTQNTAALAVYHPLGFGCERDLYIMSYDPDPTYHPRQHPALRAADPRSLLAHYASFHSTRASWQREQTSLKRHEPRMHGLGYYQDGHLIGYALYEYNSLNYSLVDVAVSPDDPQAQQAARALIAELQLTFADLAGYVINVADDDPLLDAYLAQRYQIWHRQHELRWIVT